MTKCEEKFLFKILSGAAAGTCAPDQVRLFKDHVMGCSDCLKSVLELAGDATERGWSPAGEPPSWDSEGVWKRILQGIQGAQSTDAR